MPSVMEVGTKIAELCRQKKWMEAINTFYAPNIVSIEAMASPDPTKPQRMEGIAAIRGKTEWWVKNHDVHSVEVHGPFPHGDRFILHMKMDVTGTDGPMKGHRMAFDEAALYTVKDGKIVHEEFFYHMPGQK